MSARLRYAIAAPGVYKAMLQLSEYTHHCGLEEPLLNLVDMRASQINGCAFCLDMHSKDARAAGESEQRLNLLPVWREARSFYSEREQAALEWTEAVTLVAEDQIPDDVYDRVHPHFTDEELTNLTLAIAAINSWNRLNVAFRTPAGSYKPRQRETQLS
ncbi:carboxymuconolactone decarboxylase family protein [Ktedonospora formicarum]|uniref:Alkyl hydroperoxide reductase AhpD n=1 Tax=Ktedonospora formicarum TaxID=2778364 RepID=A0A8J3HWK7_9CHLR|nr:carboxymuconolactone decarboxylase family protein [Ktedonospora formicarum]GHO42007.1 alkyl hydroperoxide reductase AhpD [Ktedonospora formicarum]